MIYSVVSMIIKSEMMDDFLAECRKIRPLVLSEPGCLMYDYTREINVSSDRQERYIENRITLYEKWFDQNALDVHSNMPYMSEFGKSVAPMREKVEIRTGEEAF